MKKINLLLSVFSILLFVACSDVEPLDPALSGGTSNNNNNNGGSNGGNGSGSGGGSGSVIFSADIDGVNFTAETTTALLKDTSFGEELSIIGLMPDESISIQLLNPAISTFPASMDFNDLLIFQYQNLTLGSSGMFSSYDQNNNLSVGTITISMFDRTANVVSGTFSFTAFNSTNSTQKAITNGVFTNIPFDNQID